MDTNRDSAHQSQNEDNFATFSLGLEFLNEGEKEKNNGKGDLASASPRFASLSVFVRRIPPAMLKNNWFMLLAVDYRVMEHVGSSESTQEARVALSYRLGQLLRFFRALQTSRVLHNSIVHAKA